MKYHGSIPRFVIGGTALAAAASSPAADLDLRRSTDAAGRTEISFCARPSPNSFGFPGHAFIVFNEKPVSGAGKMRAVGHTVSAGAGGAATAFTYFGGSSVGGVQAEERFTHMKQACLTALVDRADYNAAVAAARPTLTHLGIADALAASVERYSLNENDCIDFIVRVARALTPIGLNVPQRTAADRPLSYVEKLKQANPPGR